MIQFSVEKLLGYLYVSRIAFSQVLPCFFFFASSSFGTVRDVRIPCQHRRMFGFVTFASADTVKKILSKGNPHYICSARVLVKPYKEKPKILDRYASHSCGFDEIKNLIRVGICFLFFLICLLILQ